MALSYIQVGARAEARQREAAAAHKLRDHGSKQLAQLEELLSHEHEPIVRRVVLIRPASAAPLVMVTATSAPQTALGAPGVTALATLTEVVKTDEEEEEEESLLRPHGQDGMRPSSTASCFARG